MFDYFTERRRSRDNPEKKEERERLGYTQWMIDRRGSVHLLHVRRENNVSRTNCPTSCSNLVSVWSHASPLDCPLDPFPLSCRSSLWYLWPERERLLQHSRNRNNRSAREIFEGNDEQYFLSHWSPWIWFHIHWKARREGHARSFVRSSSLPTYLFALLSADLTFIVHVTFVSNQHSFDFGWGVLKRDMRHSAKRERRSNIYFFDVSNPVLDVIKTLFTCDVIHQHDSLEWLREMSRRSMTDERYHRSSIISSGDCFEPFLSSSIPERRSFPSRLIDRFVRSTRSEVWFFVHPNRSFEFWNRCLRRRHDVSNLWHSFSLPIVEMNVVLKAESQKRKSTQVWKELRHSFEEHSIDRTDLPDTTIT